MKNPLMLMTIFVITVLTGCATTSNISPQYVSPHTYASYNCSSLSEEYNRIGTYITQAEKKSFSLSSTGMKIGMYGNRHGIHPTISFGVGQSTDNDARDIELSRLYGERDAVIQTARTKSCLFVLGLKVFGENKSATVAQ